MSKKSYQSKKKSPRYTKKSGSIKRKNANKSRRRKTPSKPRKRVSRKALSKPKNVDISNIEGRCMKCRKQKKMTNAKIVVLKNNRSAAKGHCGECSTKMFKFV